jgi:hypothetical protein
MTGYPLSGGRHGPCSCTSCFFCSLPFYFRFTERHVSVVSWPVLYSGGSEFESRFWYLLDWDFLRFSHFLEQRREAGQNWFPLLTIRGGVLRTAGHEIPSLLSHDRATEHHLKPAETSHTIPFNSIFPSPRSPFTYSNKMLHSFHLFPNVFNGP